MLLDINQIEEGEGGHWQTRLQLMAHRTARGTGRSGVAQGPIAAVRLEVDTACIAHDTACRAVFPPERCAGSGAIGTRDARPRGAHGPRSVHFAA